MRALGWLLILVGLPVGAGGIAAGCLLTAGLGLLVAALGGLLRQRAP